jgi:CheY-like chemotaxis protein
MVRLVEDLLDISRITKGKLQLRTERVELRGAMSRAAESARPFLDARRHEFSLLLPTEPLWVEGDPGRLEQVAVNLLNNAAKYTDTGGLIRMTVAREGDEAVVRVLDNGVGVPPAILPKVFGLFTQVDGSLNRSHGGLGIGLALVRTLVEMQGGRVTAASGGLGTGSEFAVKLPALDGAAAPPMATTLEASGRLGNSLRVLVVEDNVDAGDSLSMLLRLHGHQVLVARTGPSALQMAAAFRPSLVLLDIGLPGMDGYEVARRLRADPGFAGVTLCALTGYTPTEADRLKPNRAGVRPPLRQTGQPGHPPGASEDPRVTVNRHRVVTRRVRVPSRPAPGRLAPPPHRPTLALPSAARRAVTAGLTGRTRRCYPAWRRRSLLNRRRPRPVRACESPAGRFVRDARSGRTAARRDRRAASFQPAAGGEGAGRPSPNCCPGNPP